MDPKTSWCIVALPEEDHVVNEVSSEKAAHMTLLFLGEQKEPALAIRIIEALQHTIKTSFPTKFSIGVERRGTLGKDQADVLFFYKDETGRVQDFRSLLLKNDDIKQAYDSTFQYPEWTPHLTLGYPDRPAKPIPSDKGSISWITFDRIALWLEDSNGPEVRLSSHTTQTNEFEHSARIEKLTQKGRSVMADTDDFLAHYGVKGMKWGVRKGGRIDRALETKKKRAGNTSVARSLVSADGVTGVDIIRNKGNVKKAVASRNQKNVDRIDRVQKGKASAIEMVSVYGGLSLADIALARKK